MPCPHCREAFDGDDARPAPDPPARAVGVVFEEIADDPPPAKPPAAVRRAEPPPRRSKPPQPSRPRPPRQKPAAKPKPLRNPRPAADSDSWLRDDDLLDDSWDGEIAVPADPRSAKKPSSRRRKRKQLRVRREWSPSIGLWLVSGVTLAVLGLEVWGAVLSIPADGVSPVDAIRWCLSAGLLLKIWEGRNWARVTLVVLLTLGTGLHWAARGAVAAAVRRNAGRLSPEELAEAIAGLELLDLTLWGGVAVAVTLCLPCVGAFLRRQRGER